MGNYGGREEQWWEITVVDRSRWWVSKVAIHGKVDVKGILRVDFQRSKSYTLELILYFPPFNISAAWRIISLVFARTDYSKE